MNWAKWCLLFIRRIKNAPHQSSQRPLGFTDRVPISIHLGKAEVSISKASEYPHQMYYLGVLSQKKNSPKMYYFIQQPIQMCDANQWMQSSKWTRRKWEESWQRYFLYIKMTFQSEGDTLCSSFNWRTTELQAIAQSACRQCNAELPSLCPNRYSFDVGISSHNIELE